MDSAFLRTMRRPSFIEIDDDIEAGFSAENHYNFSKPSCYNTFKRRSTYRVLSHSSSSSSRSAIFYDNRFEESHYQDSYFLESCFLCKKPLGNNRDIFMYRGDTPFCSEECREEQIEIDETEEKNRNLSTSMKAIKRDQKKNSTSTNKTQNYPIRNGTIAAA